MTRRTISGFAGRQLSREEAQGALIAYERLFEVFGFRGFDEENSWKAWVARRIQGLQAALGNPTWVSSHPGTLEHSDPADPTSNRPNAAHFSPGDGSVVTCRITGNACGSDTRPVGDPCRCISCQAFEQEQENRARAATAGTPYYEREENGIIEGILKNRAGPT